MVATDGLGLRAVNTYKRNQTKGKLTRRKSCAS